MMAETVGFIGLGVMGRPMARNLLKRGFSLVVHSRSQPPVDEIVAAGAKAAASPTEVARQAQRIITMLPDGPDVERVLAGPDGVFSTLQRDSILIDMSTIAPATTRRLAADVASRGASMLDAPVSGGEIGAIDGTLSIMVGGDGAALETVRPILEGMGNPERIIYIGESGAGQICKACNQLVIGGTLAAVGEAFALARKSGVEPSKVRTALLGGFAASRVLEVHGERLLQENFRPGFPARLYRKDLRIVIDALNDAQVPAPVTAIVQQLLTALIAQDKQELDYSALGTVLLGARQTNEERRTKNENKERRTENDVLGTSFTSVLPSVCAFHSAFHSAFRSAFLLRSVPRSFCVPFRVPLFAPAFRSSFFVLSSSFPSAPQTPTTPTTPTNPACLRGWVR